jgi:SAM-dependent methyltransferase
VKGENPMPSYAILQNPGHNRVYFNASRSLSIHELMLCAPHVRQVREQELGGIPYIVFETETALSESELTRLSRLSFTYAIFLMHDGTLIPLDKNSAYVLNDDISTMLKYTGKTNELFTRLMLNIAISFVQNDDNQPLRVLDPLCGKGTTLFEALLPGHHAAGIEIDEKLAHEAVVFFKKYLETAKVKHSNHTEKVSGSDHEGKKFTAARHRVTLTKDKLDFEIIAGNTVHANTYFKKKSMHVIVGDLPYGVQHGSTATSVKKDKAKGSITRNAMGMLTEALPQWLKVLKTGGVIALAWNLFLIPRSEMDELFIKHGLIIPDETKDKFVHRVDQAINRDFIIGIKKG